MNHRGPFYSYGAIRGRSVLPEQNGKAPFSPRGRELRHQRGKAPELRSSLHRPLHCPTLVSPASTAVSEPFLDSVGKLACFSGFPLSVPLIGKSSFLCLHSSTHFSLSGIFLFIIFYCFLLCSPLSLNFLQLYSLFYFFFLRKIIPELTAANPPLFAEEDWP